MKGGSGAPGGGVIVGALGTLRRTLPAASRSCTRAYERVPGAAVVKRPGPHALLVLPAGSSDGRANAKGDPAMGMPFNKIFKEHSSPLHGAVTTKRPVPRPR